MEFLETDKYIWDIMESLIIDKDKLINKLTNIIAELNTIKHDLERDNLLTKVIESENVNSNCYFKETAATKGPTKTTQQQPKGGINISGYTSYDSLAGLPDMGF